MFEVENDSDRRNDPALAGYLRNIARYPLLTHQEEADLACRVRHGDREALDAMVNANLRFVVSVAKKFRGRGLAFMDLIAEGNVGLITAARRYDERRGLRFVTYAVWWIRQAIQTALQDHTRTVRLPANRVRQLGAIKQAETRLVQTRMQTVGPREVAAELGLDESRFLRIQGACAPNISLDAPLGEDGDTLAEMLPDPRSAAPAEAFTRGDLGRLLEQALTALDPREREIIRHYYGLDEGTEWSLAAIGQEFNLSRERVRQIRQRAFAKIRQSREGKNLQQFLG